MKPSRCKILAALLFLSGLQLTAQTPQGLISVKENQETAGHRDPGTVAAWKENKFSLFIHFGIYSALGGVWEGKPVTRGLSEQIQAHAGIYSDTYAHVADGFDPIRWNADSIAWLAKAAGMRSIVITAKHHDGFCMFHSAWTDFNIVDATPFKRDIVKELSEACGRYGLRFGVYFSLIDWHFPQAAPISSHNSDVITPEHHEYNKKQVRELLTRYGPLSEIWFDMGSQSAAQSKELADLVHGLQPDCLISSRIGNDQGDFTVMGDNQEPNYRIGVPWQSPASFFDDTWGYRSWENRGSETDKTREKLASLIRVVSRGGNYLLNIGPRGDGSVVPFEKNVLLALGKWLQKNGEAIYNTRPDPFDIGFDWGSITSRPGKLYLHLLHPPQTGLLRLPGISGKPLRVYTLGEEGENALGQAYSTRQGITLTLPAGTRSDLAGSLHPSPLYKVVVLEFRDDFSVLPAHRIAAGKGPLLLDHGNSFKDYSNSTIDYNSRYTSTIRESWNLLPTQNKTYIPTLYYSAEENNRSLVLSFGPANGSFRKADERSDTIRLEGDEKMRLLNDTASLRWSPLYKAGPFPGGIDDLPAKAYPIDLAEPWPYPGDSSWIPLGKTSGELPAGMTTVYYLVQQIVSPKDQSCLVRITRGDGILVLLNGKQLLVHNNPCKAPQMEDYLLLSLHKGNNQLLVKLFNNFHKKIDFSIEHEGVEQVLYRKRLDPVRLTAGQLYRIGWQLDHPHTPHEEMRIPNLSLKLE